MARETQVVLEMGVLDYLIAHFADDVDVVLDAFVDDFVRVAQEVAPRRTGALAGSIQKAPATARGVREVVAGGDAAPYAFWVFYGTGRQPPRPFLLWAMAQLTGEWTAVLSAAFAAAVDRAGGR